ncbi:MAG: glycosyltransferase family 4 protein [Thermoplasmata archaeon]
MRVIELSQRFVPAIGGVEATLGELSLRLREAGVEVEVLTTDLERSRPFTRWTTPPPEVGVPVRRFRAVRVAPLPLGLGIVAPGMLPAAISSRADVLHAHAFGYSPTWVGATVRRLRSIPLVVTTHADGGRGFAFSQLYHRAVARFTLRSADRVIVQSDAERGFLGGLGVPAERMVTIPTGISLDELASPPRTSDLSRPRLLSVGRLDLQQKDLLTLIRALARLPRSLPVEAEVIGDDWGGLSPVRALAQQLGVSGQISLRTTVPRDALVSAYRTADIFVLPSRFESFPRVLLEAMAAGLPIIATRVGGVSELLSEGRNALLVPPNDPLALSEAIVQLASSPPLRQRFGEESRARAQMFAWPRLIPRYVSLFAELAAATPHRP